MIRGTSHDQDSRFTDKCKEMLDKSTWPDQYSIKIDLSKVDYNLIKLWIDKKIQQLLGTDDDIISGTAIGLLDQALQNQQRPNAKNIHVALSGFLGGKTLTFMIALWQVLNDAQKSPKGIPSCLIEEKKKQQQAQKKNYQQLMRKKEKLKSYKFSEAITRNLPRDQRKRQPQRSSRRKSQQKNQNQSVRKQRHRRSRSRSNDRHRRKKYQQYSESIDKKVTHRRKRQKQKSSSHSQSDKQQKKRSRKNRMQKGKKSKRQRLSQSDQSQSQMSSSVVSSSKQSK